MSKPKKSASNKSASTSVIARTPAATPAKLNQNAPASKPAQAAGAPLNRTVEAKPQAGRDARQITSQAVSEAAYYLWLRRGGNDVVNWLEAEAMLRNGETVA